MSTYRRLSGAKHEHGFEGSCRAAVHSHPGGGTAHGHDEPAESPGQPPPPGGPQAVLRDDRVALTPRELAAIAALQDLGTRWPRSLTLISMSGDLHVMRTGDPRYGRRYGHERQKVILANIDGILNDGGAW